MLRRCLDFRVHWYTYALYRQLKDFGGNFLFLAPSIFTHKTEIVMAVFNYLLIYFGIHLCNIVSASCVRTCVCAVWRGVTVDVSGWCSLVIRALLLYATSAVVLLGRSGAAYMSFSITSVCGSSGLSGGDLGLGQWMQTSGTSGGNPLFCILSSIIRDAIFIFSLRGLLFKYSWRYVTFRFSSPSHQLFVTQR